MLNSGYFLEIVKILNSVVAKFLFSLRTTLNKLKAVVTFLISFL